MKLNDFVYSLPENLIAQYPLKRRDQARLLIIDRKKKSITHNIFANLNDYLPSKSCLVLNDSKVVHARLRGRRQSGAEVEVFLLKRLRDGYSYETLMRPLRRLKQGETLQLNNGCLTATIVDKDKRIVRFPKKNIADELKRYGHIPLPPYIKREDRAEDKKYYQTVYAKKEGSVAAPTAGLHFTKPLMNKLKKEGHKIEKVTLHINYGTFKPVEEEDIHKHKMHEEEYAVTKKTWDAVTKVKDQGAKIVAVGTTSARVLETIAERGQSPFGDSPLQGITNKFIYPGYQFKMVDALLTNFHLPKSTLLMLACAFGGHDLIMKAYKEAIARKYRFYSYGDAMLIL